MLKHKDLLSWVCLAVTLFLVGLVSSCYKPSSISIATESPSIANPVPIENPATIPLDTPDIASSDIDLDIEQYKLEVYGLVTTPLTLTYEAILAYPVETQTAGLYCDNEFLSASTWAGVPVSTLLTEAGIRPEAESIIFHARDGYSATLAPADVMPGGIILAYMVDGQKLSDGDGYPLRVVANGYNGSDWVRWLISIEVK